MGIGLLHYTSACMCFTNHPNSLKNQHESIIVKRAKNETALDISFPIKHDVKLVLTVDRETFPQYATLSYCLGP